MTHNSWTRSSVTPNLLNKHVYPHNSPSYLTKVITLSICKLGIHLANELWRFWTQIFSWTSLVTNITCTTICSTFQNVKTQAHSQYKEFKIHFENIIWNTFDIFILPVKILFLVCHSEELFELIVVVFTLWWQNDCTWRYQLDTEYWHNTALSTLGN